MMRLPLLLLLVLAVASPLAVPLVSASYPYPTYDIPIAYMNEYEHLRMGVHPLNNCTVYNDGALTLEYETSEDSMFVFSGFFNYTLYFFWDGDYIAETNVTSDTFLFYYNLSGTNANLSNWLLGVNTSGKIVLLRSAPTMVANLATMFQVNTMTGFWYGMWGDLLYGVLLMLPVTYYIKTREIGGAAILLLLLGAAGIGFSMYNQWESPLRYIAIVVCAVAMAMLVYRWSYRSERSGYYE